MGKNEKKWGENAKEKNNNAKARKMMQIKGYLYTKNAEHAKNPKKCKKKQVTKI